MIPIIAVFTGLSDRGVAVADGLLAGDRITSISNMATGTSHVADFGSFIPADGYIAQIRSVDLSAQLFVVCVERVVE